MFALSCKHPIRLVTVVVVRKLCFIFTVVVYVGCRRSYSAGAAAVGCADAVALVQAQ